MKKTATILALAGLSMAAKTEHSFLGRKPVEIKADIDPKMVIKPVHDIDPGMVRRPNKNIDPGMVIKPKKTQGPTILTADDNDDELLLVYRPADNIDPGMVRKPPVDYDIDPKIVIKPPRGFDDGIYWRPRPKGELLWADDEMRLASGSEIDPGMVIKPKRGDIDPGMVRKPVKGWEIDPKIFVKPQRSDVLYADDDELTVVGHVREPRLIGDFPTNWPGKPVYADAEDNELAVQSIGTISVSDPIFHGGHHDDADDELAFISNRVDPGMVRRPPHQNIDQGILRRPKDNIKYFDAENDDELAFISMSHINRVQNQLQDDELVQMTEFVREPRVIGETKSSAMHADDDELAYISTRIDPEMVRKPYYETIDQGIWKRPLGNVRYFDAENDDELAAFTYKQVKEPRLIGDFPINWPNMPVYADDADDELIMFADESLTKPRKGIFDPRELTKPWYQQQQTMYADDADDELVFFRKGEQKAGEKVHHHKNEKKGKEETGHQKVNDLKTGKAANPKVKPAKSQEKPVNEADDELILFADKSLDARLEKRRMPFDLKELTKPWYQQQQTMYADDSLVALGELLEDN